MWLAAALAVESQTVALDCQLWGAPAEVEVTTQSQFEPIEKSLMIDRGVLRIIFEDAGNALRNVRVLPFSDPLNLARPKPIVWEAKRLEGKQIYLRSSPFSKNAFRWLMLDPIENAKFAVRWSMKENAPGTGGSVYFVGSGFGECARAQT
jgi:hypothetical protein